MVRKDSIRAVLSGVSLNDTLLVGPTVHSSLVDVLLRFWFHRVALVADVSRAIALTESDRDLHRFVWRNPLNDPSNIWNLSLIFYCKYVTGFAKTSHSAKIKNFGLS